MNPLETVDAGAEASDGEEVPPIVSEESRVEEVFTEVEQRGKKIDRASVRLLFD